MFLELQNQYWYCVSASGLLWKLDCAFLSVFVEQCVSSNFQEQKGKLSNLTARCIMYTSYPSKQVAVSPLAVIQFYST